MNEQEFHKQKTLPGVESTEDNTLIKIPDTIGPYKIEGLLEKGGMSLLYLATHPQINEPIVVKVLEPNYLSRPEIVQRFLRETEIISLPDHPNIVKLYGHGEWEGGLYIAMEFIKGVSLRRLLLTNPPPLKKALEIVIDIAYALCHLHANGIIHRDLKPENVLITNNREIKVIDFGIAQLLTEQPNPAAPAKPRIIGTPVYMSPEQRNNPDTVSYPSDIYSLGIITYELVLGQLSYGQIHLGLVSQGLKNVLQKALQHNPKDRYQDIVDFITDVTTYLESTNFKKEKLPKDYLSEFVEEIKNAQDALSPQTPPNWPKLSIHIALHKGTHACHPYYHFLQFPNHQFGIMLAKWLGNSAQGILKIASLHGAIHALTPHVSSATELIQKITTLFKEDELELGCLVLDPTQGNLFFISSGQVTLWMLPSSGKHPQKISSLTLKEGENQITIPFTINDVLILSSSALPNDLSKEWSQIHEPPLSIIGEKLLRKIKIDKQRSCTILSIKKESM